jgi:methylenetetrahydrofolate reductase (NADPH)
VVLKAHNAIVGERNADLLAQAYLEVLPMRSVVDQLANLPPRAWIGISCSPRAGIGATLDRVDEIRRRYPDHGFRLAPHLAARVFRDRAQLVSVVDRLHDAGVRAVFVPAGDAAEPAGPYGGALELLRELVDIGHPFEHVGVAAYPEGHPLIGREELMRLLLAKQAYASYFVTQLCFDPDAIVRWLRDARDAGVTLHAWPGLPGPVELGRLLGLSLRIGVGQSLRMLRKQKGLARNLSGGLRYQPDALFERLAPALADPALGVHGFHLYSFNQVSATERWRCAILDRLGTTEPTNP